MAFNAAFGRYKNQDNLYESSVASSQRSPLLHESTGGSNARGNDLNLNGPSTLYQIITHDTKKKTLEKGFDARQNFVHFAHGDLKNVITMQELMERPSVRNFLYRSKWYQKPQVVHLRSIMSGSAVSCCSFLSLLVALFCGDLFAFLSVPGNALCDIILTVAFGFFAFEFVLNAFSDRTYPLSFFFYMDLIGTFSMVFDISYMCGPDAMSIERLHTSSSSGGGVIVMRAARAARLGARAGRLSRVAKIVRFVSGSEEEGSGNVRMAKVISNKLSDVLSIRVAFVVICVAVVLPSLSIFEYPEMEESLTAWTSFLAPDVQRYAEGARGEMAVIQQLLRDLSKFYSTANYGPFLICYRKTGADLNSEELLACGATDDTVKFEVEGHWAAPARREFVMATSQGQMDLLFDLAEPKRLEALMGISLIMFIILVMVAFSIVLTENISTVALLPLERMLDVVRHRCAQIFKYTNALQEEPPSDDEDEEEREDEDVEDKDEEDNEFALLEKAVAKLGAIAELSAKDQDPNAKKDWTENEIIVHEWTQPTESLHKQSVVSQVMDLTRRMSMLVEDNDALIKLNEDASTEVMDEARKPGFNAFKLTPSQIKALSVRLLREQAGTKDFVRRYLKPVVLVQFVNVLEPMYLPNPFHNFVHAVDVLCWLTMEMENVEVQSFLADSDQFALLVAALGHDVGHLGVNNQFLVATSHELAVIYNDKSPLENMHCCKLFQVLGHEAQLFQALDKETYKRMRKDIIEAILHTDITKHNEMVKDLSLFYQMNKDVLNIAELSAEAREVLKSNTSLMMCSFLHSADVNNPSRPWHIAEKMAHLCVDEFFAQGDKEKELGIPVGMLNDRDKVNRAFSQIGFIEFMIAPWVEALVPMFPVLDFMADYTAENIHKWAVLWENEVEPPAEQVEKLTLRVQKVVGKLMTQKGKAL